MQVMDPQGSPNTSTSAISPSLAAAISSSFGSFEAMKAQLSDQAKAHFGSGWAWLCDSNDATGGKELFVVTTANQDNPLMAPELVGTPRRCTPILGIDVWEHAYYLKHRNQKASYVDAWWSVANWAQVSRNLEHARSGQPDLIVQ